eukprot:TRINITY_DN49444_c0_g1_i1.p2 TRINITY_DN49444_c0_g1~~TRINITY_DN49444_c0_g1_i1.p2  ORF type:complete len:213 (+),score=64.23 TRINITY_DN49444_c0_g1_i1:102-740(+)
MGRLTQPANPKGLCVFDIDATLTSHAKADAKVCGVPEMPKGPVCTSCIGRKPGWKAEMTGTRNSFPAAYGQEAIKQCLDHGYAVGLATARTCQGDTLKARLQWLEKMGFPKGSVMTPMGTPGPAVGCQAHSAPGNKLHKDQSILSLMHHFKVPAKRTVFFDDSRSALLAAQKAIPGLNIQQASSNCKGEWCPSACGLTRAEFHKGFSKTRHH